MFNIIETTQAWALTFSSWENSLEAAAFLLPVRYSSGSPGCCLNAIAQEPIIQQGYAPSWAYVQQVLFDKNLVWNAEN